MVRSIKPAEAQELLAKGNIDLVDVRESHEWMTGHLPGARLVPLGQLTVDPDGARLGNPVLFVCEGGGRSLRAGAVAEGLGIADVYSLEGGTAGWKAAGLPVERPSSSSGLGSESEAPELDAVVGENIKQMRTARGYSLDVLAGMSGVGRQTLGQIELGRTVPSLGTLWKIARAFEVPFSVLLARKGNAETRIFRAATAKRIVDADGRFSSRLLFTPEETGAAGFEFYELWLAGHGREVAEAHAPGTRENLVVTSGRLKLEVGTQTYELAKGDAIAFTADVPHAYINPGAEECWMNLVMKYDPAR